MVREHGPRQEMKMLKLSIIDATLMMCDTHNATWQVDASLKEFSGLPGLYSRHIYSLNLMGNQLTQIPANVFKSKLFIVCLT